MDLVECRWNGRWGSLARMDVQMSIVDGGWRTVLLERHVARDRIHVGAYVQRVLDLGTLPDASLFID
ncbi:hypothetical protein [Dactylosporangium darangshiense]|uniref:hypothetical protein n=1 Tax=Dactylosporangium darangshiense TaxID=579108 RepID=UPI0031EA3A11